MKLDWNKTRCLLVKVEALNLDDTLDYSVEEQAKYYHARLLERDGYLVAVVTSDGVEIDDLTIKGHRLLKQLRNSNGNEPDFLDT